MTGRIIGASKVARDITERNRADREREELLRREKAARQEAQHANRLLDDQVEALRREVLEREKAQSELAEALDSRDEFIAVAAHELRNPLNVLTLTLQLLQRISGGPSTSSQVRLLTEQLRVQLGRLGALVDRLFDVTQIQTDRFELYREKFDLCGLIRKVRARFADEHSDVVISLELQSIIEGTWDQVRIDQALTNLLSNAIKFGRQNPITVSALVKDREAIIRVQDQGIGLSHEDVERIFNRFERAGGDTGHKGLGLGLWITKRILEAHSGTILVESELGKGSVFIMRLPIQG